MRRAALIVIAAVVMPLAVSACGGGGSSTSSSTNAAEGTSKHVNLSKECPPAGTPEASPACKSFRELEAEGEQSEANGESEECTFAATLRKEALATAAERNLLRSAETACRNSEELETTEQQDFCKYKPGLVERDLEIHDTAEGRRYVKVYDEVCGENVPVK